jgi:uncharacterized protein (TIRG00374 family)
MPESEISYNSNSQKPRKWPLIVFRLIVAIVILFILFSKIPIAEVVAAIGQTNFPYAFAAFFMAFLTHVGASFRLKILCELQNIKLSTFDVFNINTSSRFYGLFLPGGNFTGIAIRFYRLSIIIKKYTEAMFAMLCDRIFATIGLCIVGALFWIIELPRETEPYFRLMIIALVGVLVILILIALIKPVSVLDTLRKRAGRLKFGKIKRLINSSEYQPQLPARTISVLFVLSCILHIFGIISYYLIGVAMGLNLSFLSIGWIRSAVIVVTMIPVSISGIGLREGAMVILLGMYDIQANDALAYSFVIFSVTVLGIGIIGGIFEAMRILK